MKRLLLLFSHNITNEQKIESKEKLKCDKIIPLSYNLKKKWKQIPSSEEFPFELANTFIEFIKNNSAKEDYVLVQGEYGISFYIVDWCFKNERIPIYATTMRKTVEKIINKEEIKKESVFSHITFRKYIKYE